MTRFTLHGMWPSGPSYKAGLMLRLTGTPYNYVHVDLREGAQRSAPHLARSRFGKVPALEDHELGLCVCESSVILQYLAEVTGQFLGSGLADNLRIREWQSWAVTGLATGLYRTRAARLGFFQFPEAVTAGNEAEARAGLGVLDSHLADLDWLVAGKPTIADIDLYAIAGYAPQAGIDLEPYPNVRRWMGNMQGLPGFAGVEDGLPRESVAA